MSYYDDDYEEQEEEPDETWETLQGTYNEDEEDGDGNGYVAGRYDD